MTSDTSSGALHPDIQAILSQGRALARQGHVRLAQSRFIRVLSLQPDNQDALLWLAGLAEDPRQAVRYLDRVLQLDPDHRHARAGMSWARRRLQQEGQGTHPSPVSLPWLDTVLLSGIAMVCIAACVLLGLMAWEAPRMVMAAFAPTQTFTPTYTMMPTHTAAPTSTTTPTPVATWTLQPTSTPTDTPAPTRVAADVSSGSPSLSTDLGAKWLLIDLSDQRLTAYEGETPMLTALVSTGIARYPTPPGDYTIIRQVRRQVMSGPGYYLPNVEYVSYFYRGYAIHGTYWHSNFGNPMSHGCVNMTNQDASWIYDWAPIGTPVQVRP